jgi:NADH:ubiquinone reductase (H+-translocating)
MSESLPISQAPEQSLVPGGQGIKRPHVVIVGGGFAGIAAVKALRHCEANVTVIDRRNHYIFQPLLYQVATAVLAPADVAAPIRQLSARQKNVSVLLAEVIGVDLGSRFVAVKYPGGGTKKIAFDYLVVAAGSAIELLRSFRICQVCALLEEHHGRANNSIKNPECIRIGGIHRQL